MPAGGERPGFGLTITYHDQGYQIWIVEDATVRVRNAISQLAALVNTPGSFGSGVASDATRKENCLKNPCMPARSFTLIRIDFRIRSLQIGTGKDRRVRRDRVLK